MSAQAARRIMHEFSSLTKEHRGRSQVASVRFIDDSDIYTWRLQLKNFDNDCEGGRNLNADLARLHSMCGQDHLEFEIRFPQDYPNSPFFCRVVSPRCVMYTGHVTAGGSICLEMLTLSGTPGSWHPSITVSGVLVVVLNNMINCDVAHITTMTGPGGRTGPLRVDFTTIYNGRVSTYSEQEAKAAFSRMLYNHQRVGWNSGVNAATLARVLQAPSSPDTDAGASTPSPASTSTPQLSRGVGPLDVQLAGGGLLPAASVGNSSRTSSLGAAPSRRSLASAAPDSTEKVAQMIDMLQIDAALASAILEMKRNNVEDAVAWYFENGESATVESVNSLIQRQSSAEVSETEADVIDLCSDNDDDVDSMSDQEIDDSSDGDLRFDSDVDMGDHDGKFSTSDITHVADVTKLERRYAEELLRSSDGNVGDALEGWMNDEVSIREMLDLIPCEQEKQTASAVRSISMRLAQEEGRLAEMKAQLDSARNSQLMQDAARLEEVETEEKAVTAQERLVQSFRTTLAKAQDDFKEAQALRRVTSVPGDIYQRRISKLTDTWVTRVPNMAWRPVYTRTNEATARLYAIHADRLVHPAEVYHYSYVTAQFQRSFGATTGGRCSYKVTKVEVNENPEVEARYRATRKQFFDAGKPVVEELVFHGTPDARIMDQICAEGFEIGGSGVAVRHGAAYGNGVYVARKASLSLSYAGGTQKLLLCKCAVGKKYQSYSTYSNANTHDCVEVMGMDALVLKSKSQVLPKYIVHLSPGRT